MKQNLLQLITLLTFSIIQAQGTWTVYNTSNSDLTFNEIGDIEFDSHGNIWVASDWNFSNVSGIAKFDDTNWTLFNTENIQKGTDDIHKIEFTTGVLQNWVSVYATTVVQFADGTQATIESSHDYSTNKLQVEIPVNATSLLINYYIEDASMVEMKFYNVATNETVSEGTFSNNMDFEFGHTFFQTISIDNIVDIAIDNLDTKWLGTSDKGLVKFDDVDWTNYRTSNSGLPNERINCLATDSNNTIWIGTESGLTKFDGTNWETYNTTNSDLPTNAIISIAIDANDHVWISTANELVQFTGAVWNIYNDNSVGNYFGRPNSLVIDGDNKKWMSSGYGIKSFDGVTWEYFNYLDDNNTSCLLDCQITCVSVDTNNDIWIGAHQECNNGGLLNFNECNAYVSSNSELPDNSIIALNIDKDGVKWIGTYNGLAKLDASLLSIQDQNYDEQKIMLYQHRAADYITIEIDNNLIRNEFIIFDSTGKKVKNGVLENNSNSINIADLGKNIYFFIIKGGAKDLETIKFVI